MLSTQLLKAVDKTLKNFFNKTFNVFLFDSKNNSTNGTVIYSCQSIYALTVERYLGQFIFFLTLDSNIS